MPVSAPVDGFRLAYDRAGSGPPVVLLHGWPGDRADYRAVVPLLSDVADVVVPDLRAPVLAGYDIGSRIAQAVAAAARDRARALIVSPPLPGVGARVLEAGAAREFWYQHFHRLPLSEQLVDGTPAAVRAYLRHFWSHWSGPAFEPSEADLDRLAERYGAPGAFAASIGWYRAGSGGVARALTETVPAREERIALPVTVLWPEHDPLFPPAWGDRLEQFFAAVSVQAVPGAGHFIPLEAPRELAAAIRAALG